MYQGSFKNKYFNPGTNMTMNFGIGALPINIKVAQLATWANSGTKQQGYQVTEVNKLISTMLTGWGYNGNKPKSMSDNYLELILSCDNGFMIKKKIQFPHIIAWQDDSIPYNIANVYNEFSIDNWLKADDFVTPDITLVVEPIDEIITTSTKTPPEATTTDAGRFYLYYRNLPVGVNRVHIDFHIKTQTEPIDFDLEVIEGTPFVKGMDLNNKNIFINNIKDLYYVQDMEGNFEDITMYQWNQLYQTTILYFPTNKITHDLFFYPYV